MLVFTLIWTILVIVLLMNFSKFVQFIRTYYYYIKLPRASWKTIIHSIHKLTSAKENETLEILVQAFNVKKRTLSALLLTEFFTVILHPEELERFLPSYLHISKGVHYNTVKLWLRQGLLTSSGEKWHFRRKTLTPTFHFKILEDSLHVTNTNAKLLAEKFLNTGGVPFDIENYISLCTLDIICETAMGKKLDFQNDKAVEYVQDIRRICQIIIKKELNVFMHSELLFWLTPLHKELMRLLSRLHAFTGKVIASRKEALKKSRELNGEQQSKRRLAFLDCLIETEQKVPGTFTDLELREEVDTFMFEGHDTTSTALNFCLFLLAGDKEVQDKTVEEMDRIFEDSDRPVKMSDLQEMKYLEMVIKETLRLYPSVPYFTRYITQDYTLGDGSIIPAGTNVCISPLLIHRNPDIYANPEKFDPERFNEENIKQRSPFSYIPFSAGPRNCIGQKFAMMELKTIISTILRKTRLELATNPKDIKLVPRIVLKVDRPIEIRFFPRCS